MTFLGIDLDLLTPAERSGRLRLAVAVVAASALVAATGCGGKPEYCSARSDLEKSIKGLSSAASSSGISGLEAQVTTIRSNASALVSDAKSDFPTETSTLKSSIDTLSTTVKSLPSSPSTQQIAAVGLDAASVVNAVKSYRAATDSKCK
jgi:hypothetical protein